MFNANNNIAVRANAEGWNAFSVESALKAQIQLDLAAAVKAWEKSHSCYEVVDDKEVVDTLTSEYYAGGYMYSGSEVTPSKFQGRCSTNAPYTEGDIEGAQVWVSTAPVGEKVRCKYNAGNGKHEEVFEKTTNGWARTFYMCENDCPSEKYGLCLTAGVRERVAKKIGAPLSTTFHKVFDEAVESLWQ